jgi:hypothetical protein
VANTFSSTSGFVADISLSILDLELNMGSKCFMAYEKEWQDKNIKIGTILTGRKPYKFIAKDGPTLSNQDLTKQEFTLTIEKDQHVAFEMETSDKLLKAPKDIGERIIKPAMQALAVEVEAYLAGKYWQIANAVGTPGVSPTKDQFIDAAQRLTEMLAPIQGRLGFMSPAARTSVSKSMLGLFEANIVRDAIRERETGRVANINGFENTLMVTHTAGIATGTPLIKGASQVGASLATDGWTATQTGILKKGDIITIGVQGGVGVYDVHPIKKTQASYLKQFTVTADCNSDGSGNATVLISPAIVAAATGYQNVSAGPANDAVITVVTAPSALFQSVQNLVLTKESLALAMPPLPAPETAKLVQRKTSKGGMSCLLTGGYDITNRKDVSRIDILYGADFIYPETAVRMFG